MDELVSVSRNNVKNEPSSRQSEVGYCESWIPTPYGASISISIPFDIGIPANGSPVNGSPANGSPANSPMANRPPSNGWNGRQAYGPPADGPAGE